MRRVTAPPRLVREPEHVPRGDPCARCGLAASRHRERPGRGARQREARRLADLARPIVGIDGEGVDLPCPRCHLNDRDLARCPEGPWRCPLHENAEHDAPGACPRCGGDLVADRCSRPHAYTYLSAVDEDGRKLGSIYRASGLMTEEILAFLADLGEPKLFGYSLGYDLTMWVADLPDEQIYRLVRPESRAAKLPDGRNYRRRERWRGFEIDYLRRRVDVRRARWDEAARRMDRGPNTVIWDVFGFYQGPFVRSLGDWKTATRERIEEIQRMKTRRADFAHLSPREVQAYCDDECRLLARLVRQLIEAHEEAKLPLRSFYGAGSTASSLLDRMGARELRGPDLPDELRGAVQRAFFGGRFECSRVGPVAGPVWNYDISSAYPYQATHLPCLACGAWRRVTGRETDRRVREASLAVVRCRVRRARGNPEAWGPLPWRCPEVGSAGRDRGLLGGSILWPLSLDETWCWRDEYVAARDTAWPGVEAVEAWVYDVHCAHAPCSILPEVYRERCRIGKDGAGIVLKLGPNSVYGKFAQSVGGAPYRSWVWAGCITSGCRAQLLRMIARDPEAVVMVATDGILSARRIDREAPRDTGTGDCVVDGVPKPLGGWEEKEIPGGVFVARPGIYWPLGEGGVRCVKARGISRSVLGGHTCPDHRGSVSTEPGTCKQCGRRLERHSDLIEQHFERLGWRHPYVIGGGIRFVGAKAGVRMTAAGPVRSTEYGEWVHYPIEVDFRPDPKRAAVNRDGTLDPWRRMPGPSAPYQPGKRCPEGQKLRELEEMLWEQPEGEHEFDHEFLQD